MIETEMAQVEEEREQKLKKNKRVLQKLYDSIRNNKVRVMGIAREEEREKKTQNVFKEIIGKNFPNLWKVFEYKS